MFEKMLEWFAPGHREEVEKFVAHIDAIEARLAAAEASLAALLTAPAPTPAPTSAPAPAPV